MSPPPLLSMGALRSLARRPDLWTTAAKVGARMTAPGWWMRWPPVPRVPPDYAHFRLQTMFGTDTGARLDGAALVAYLAWCREMNRPRR